MCVVFLAAVLLAACSAGTNQLAETKLPPDKVRDGEHVEPKGPDYPPKPGVEELGSAGLRCYNQALKHNSVFGGGGVMVVRWKADANGDLLSLDFVRDTFGDWEINADSQTMASCVSRAVEHSTVRWSRSGMAPLKFSPDPGASSRPTSQPSSPP